ncbi:hypothetical protein INS49_013461 [Diaporthe citri]|uniref:uncharacterized protein n=1 Tax=Diaporthe citri TaxID=83186 RepID=UPI001C7E639A|nr:uncharacterized protein INS49_013461 [Diaporthe citri]KAG6357584.1 hypothetical protein INS49_013461 [Diaporthe citri]
MDSAELSLFWNSLIAFLFPLFYLLIASWFDRGHLDEPETSDTHNTSKSASYPFCHKAIAATPLRDELKRPYSGRKLSHRLERARLFHLGLNDRYLRTTYCECRKRKSVDQEVNIEEIPVTGSSLNGYFDCEPDLNAIAAKNPQNLFNSSMSMSALKRSFMGSSSYGYLGYEPDLNVLAAKAPQNLSNSPISMSAWKRSFTKTDSIPMWRSKLMKPPFWEDQNILLPAARMNPSRPQMRELLRETDEKLRPI